MLVHVSHVFTVPVIVFPDTDHDPSKAHVALKFDMIDVLEASITPLKETAVCFPCPLLQPAIQVRLLPTFNFKYAGIY